jgi:hypothetical protein
MFESKAGACSSELSGRLLALLANITPGWKGLPGTNTLAYSANLQMMKKNSFENKSSEILKTFTITSIIPSSEWCYC